MLLGMLVHPWDAAEPTEWLSWLPDFGQLIAAGRGRDFPVVVPTHFVFDGNATIWLHLARPNPVWAALDENPRALLTVIGDYTYIPSHWNATADPALGVPTSYYAAVQLQADVRVIDDPTEKAAVLNRQLGHFEPGSARLTVGETERLLSGIRGIELTVTHITAKFKYGGNKSAEHRKIIGERLAERGAPMDEAAARHLGERLTQPG
jgi:transcriptional regulator